MVLLHKRLEVRAFVLLYSADRYGLYVNVFSRFPHLHGRTVFANQSDVQKNTCPGK